MKTRKPKDPTKFVHPIIAATRLMQLVTENILWQRHGTRVHWQLKVTYYHDESFTPGARQLAVSNGFTASSGTFPAHVEAQITGHGSTDAPIQAGTCRYCECTEDDACDGGCHWVDEAMTVCSNPTCLAKHEQSLKSKND